MEPTAPTSSIPPGSSAAAVGALFEAAAALHRIDPWSDLDPAAWAIELSSEALGLRGAVIALIADQEERHVGFGVFASRAAFDAWSADREEDAPLPAHWMVSYQPAHELPPALRKEAAEHQWDLAGPGAFPVLLVSDEAGVLGPVPALIDQAEAVARALVELVADQSDMGAAFEEGEAFTCTTVVTTHAGARELRLTVALEVDEILLVTDLMVTLADLVDGDHGPDADARHAVEETLLESFAMSVEGRALPDLRWTQSFLDCAADELGLTLPLLDARHVGSVLLGGLAAKAIAPPDQAAAMVEELRAFFTFVGRTSRWPNAAPVLVLLGPALVDELTLALTPGSGFDAARSAVLEGVDPGLDMADPRGLQSWMRALEAGMPVPESAPPDAQPPRGGKPLTAKAKQKKKDKRKAAKKARKKRR